MVAAWRTASASKRRPKKWPSSRRRNTATMLASSTARVVVFIPPAVEPGEPPMSMSRIMTAWDTPPMAARSAVLNPAVRGVTDWKKESHSRSPTGSPVNSKKKNHTAGSRITRAVVTKITWLCIR